MREWAGARPGVRRGAIAVVVLATALACGSKEERAARHVERADELLAEGLRREAVLELENAMFVDLANVEARNRMAQLELENGNFEAAVRHVEAAYQADGTNIEAALNLALVLQSEQPARARALIDAAVALGPDNPRVWVALSSDELFQGRSRQAMTAAVRAAEVAPDDPRAHWQVGYVHQALIRENQMRDRPSPDAVFRGALAAFERYLKSGGTEPWKAQVEEARVLAAWEGRAREASELYRRAVESAFAGGTPSSQRWTAGAAADYAVAARDDALREWALSKLVAADPEDRAAWVSLARARQQLGRSAEDTYRELVEARPKDPDSHIEYARYFISQRRLDDALDYLEQKSRDESIDPPALLGAIADTQFAAHRVEDAEATIARLTREYPGHPRTILARVQLDLKQGQVDDALRALRSLARRSELVEVHRLLAHAEEVSGNDKQAIAAVNRAITLRRGFDIELQRLRAGLLSRSGRHRAAAQNLVAIQEHVPLSNAEIVMLARGRYEAGRVVVGRHLLEGVLNRGSSPPGAVIEYARREGSRAEHRARARRELEGLLEQAPDHLEALYWMTRFDLEANDAPSALTRLDAAVQRSGGKPPPRLRLLRAQARLALGRESGALRDAIAAFEERPRLPGALEMAVSLHVENARLGAAIALLEEAKRADALDPPRTVLLGRLYRVRGRERQALAVFEEALSSGSDDPSLKNDLAYLLAKYGGDLDRALAMASEAQQGLAGDPTATDTLGFIHLKSGRPDAALPHFEDAVERAEPPRAGFYYHLGLALDSLERRDEAIRAFEKALSISDSFPEAADARRALEVARGPSAS